MLILGGLVLPLTSPVGSVGRKVQVHVGISLSAVPMRWLLRMLALLLIGGSQLTFLYSLAFVVMLGWPMLLARLFVNLSGLPVGLILLISPPRRLLGLSRMSGMFTGMSLEWFLRKLCLLLEMLSLGLLLTNFSIWSKNAEEGLVRAYSVLSTLLTLLLLL